MLMTAFVQWWYGPGWRDASNRIVLHARNIYLSFSVPILLRTLFAPWHRLTTPPGGALQDKLRASVDNAVSRAVGFTVRLFALLGAIISILLTLVFGGLVLLIWPLAPFLGPVLIIVGLL